MGDVGIHRRRRRRLEWYFTPFRKLSRQPWLRSGVLAGYLGNSTFLNISLPDPQAGWRHVGGALYLAFMITLLKVDDQPGTSYR